MGRIKLVESVILSPGNSTLEKQVMEAFNGDLPSVIYPEIQAITASKITRNKTFYPSESLVGDRNKGTGVHSLLFPYPIPIIKDHATGGGLFGGEASPIYGRAKYARFVPSAGGAGYVSVIPAITDPHAIEMILTERFLTVSIGVETEGVNCSVCNCDLTSENSCDHKKGQTYFVDGRPQEAYWKIGPVWFQEISFVTVPSDTDARVINKHIQPENLKVLGGESKKHGEVILKEYASDFNTLKRMWGIPVNIMENTETKTEEIAAEVIENKESDETTETNDKATVVDERTPLAFLRDEKYGVEYPLFMVDKESVNPIYSAIESSNFPEDYKSKMYARLVDYCKDCGVDAPKPLGEAYQQVNTMEKDETRQPVYIPLNESTYPLLYTLIETMEQHLKEVSMENNVTKVEEKDEKDTNISESYVQEVAQLNDTISQLNEQVEALNERCIEVAALAHVRLANEVAILSKILNKPTTRDKSLEDCTKDLSKRTTQSLEDTLSDLLLEFDGSAPVNIEAVEKVESPVIKTNEVEGDSTKPLGEVGEVTETEEDSVYVHFGLDPKKLEKRLKEMKSSSNI